MASMRTSANRYAKALFDVALEEKADLAKINQDLAESFQERLRAHQNIVRADVTSAAPLSPEKMKALEESLSTVTGKKVELSVSVDPELLGGVVARIGSTVYDGSVKTHLQRMHQELSSQ
jgi:F-type H+-transporting ATPase subunit delta